MRIPRAFPEPLGGRSGKAFVVAVTRSRLTAFGFVLIVGLLAGYGIGRLNNGVVSVSAPPSTAAARAASLPGTVSENAPHGHGGGATAPAESTALMGAAVGGMSLSASGLTLVPVRTAFTAGTAQRLDFRINRVGGAPATTYATVNDKRLHLIVVRRDLSGFQHLHPKMTAGGTWGIDLALAEPGIYHMIADFTAIVGGQPVAATLGGDLTVAGAYAPRALPAPDRVTSTEGFSVAYGGTPRIDSTRPMLMAVVGAGGKLATLEPYLGAFGHLVVMRQGDLAYLHVHPETQLVAGQVKFWLVMPSAGTYRLFFEFQVAGKVHTAAWTAVIR